MENGCKQLRYTILSFGEAEGVVAFSKVGSGKYFTMELLKVVQELFFVG